EEDDQQLFESDTHSGSPAQVFLRVSRRMIRQKRRGYCDSQRPLLAGLTVVWGRRRPALTLALQRYSCPRCCSQNVTGPSLVNVTSMWAPNSPVCTSG